MLLKFLILTLLAVHNYTPFLVEGDSMHPTIKNNQFIFLKNNTTENTTQYSRGDIIVFNHSQTDEPYYYIKRIIGLPGEQIKINSLGIFIKRANNPDNDETLPSNQISQDFFKLNESYLNKIGTHYGLEKHFTVPADSYFVLGDNRNFSQDSRSFPDPYIKNSDVIGKMVK